MLPPYDPRIDPSANTVSWKTPCLILNNETFESSSFPPSGWATTSLGKGWIHSGIQPFYVWKVNNNNTGYAFADDDSALVRINGSMDLLITPPIDMTLADTCRLSFHSFYDGAYGQAASVKYRLGPDSLWHLLADVEARLGWQEIILDLSPFSGPGGSEALQLAFHADDQGNKASGWAVDNVEILGGPGAFQPLDYLIFFDGTIIDSTTGLTFPLPFEYYGEDHQFGICARYPAGNSDTIFLDYESLYLPPPDSLRLIDYGLNQIALDWDPPYHIPYCEPWDLQFAFETEFFGSEGGCETDGQYIYVCYEYANTIAKYELDGTFVETFTIPGIPGLYDLAYDPWQGLMYGGHGGYTVYEMDFNNKTLVGQFTAPVHVRGIAYDPSSGAFWGNDGSTDFTLFTDDGDSLYSFPLGEYGNYYGLAFDDTYDGPPFLWGFSNDGTGRLMVQYDVWAGLPTGLTIDVSSLSLHNGMGKGLFISRDLYENCVTIGGNLKNDVVFGYALREELPWGWDPPGVSQYKLYEHDTIIYEGSNPHYFYHPQYPNLYQFEVSALYDLGTFGYPGQFSESSAEGPVFHSSSQGFGIDFIETWSSSSFETNNWDTNGSKWLMRSNLGNPPPSATFRGMPGTGPYDMNVTSNWFVLDGDDSCETALSCDIRVFDESPTGLQSFAVEILDLLDNSWKVVRIYHNDSNMSHCLRDTINITSSVHGDVTKIRFHAYGIDSKDVVFWIFDNIHIFKLCMPPDNLQATLNSEQDSVFISWENPYKKQEEWIQRDDGIQFLNVGFDSGPQVWFDVASRWDPADLIDYEHFYVTQLAMIPTMAEAFYILKVWVGDTAETLAAEMPLNNPALNQWNAWTLEDPVPVDISKTLWIGYSVSSREGFPFSVDQGPALDGYGNLIRVDSAWTTLLTLDPGLDYNFNLHAKLERPARKVEAFQVYQSLAGDPFVHIATTDSTFLHWPLEPINEELCYEARIVCFNEPGNIVVSGYSNVDCIVPVVTDELKPGPDRVLIFPNPAHNLLQIMSDIFIQGYDVFDVNGRLLLSGHIGSKETTINLGFISTGIYIIRLNLEDQLWYGKFIIN